MGAHRRQAGTDGGQGPGEGQIREIIDTSNHVSLLLICDFDFVGDSYSGCLFLKTDWSEGPGPHYQCQ